MDDLSGCKVIHIDSRRRIALQCVDLLDVGRDAQAKEEGSPTGYLPCATACIRGGSASPGWARLFELQDTPDNLGFFGYKRSFNAYFEVISYSKLVADAEKRNKVFFQKLGLPRGNP